MLTHSSLNMIYYRCIFNSSPSLVNGYGNGTKPILSQELINKNMMMNIYRDGVWGSMRHLPLPYETTLRTPYAYANVLTRGNLSSIRWIESPLKYYNPDKNGRTLCSVYYASLNFRDIMFASGKLPPDAIPGSMAMLDCLLGMEYSGRNSQGEKIMGLTPSKVCIGMCA